MKKALANRVSFRALGSVVSKWHELGLSSDPSIDRYEQIKEMNLENIKKFTKDKISENKLIITLVGDKNRLDLDKLSEFGKIIELNSTDIAN